MGLREIDNQVGANQPIAQIPDDWAKKASCPVCTVNKSLEIIHLEMMPDQFLCQNCSATFQVQSSSSKIRIKVLPKILKSEFVNLLDQWVDPVEVQAFYQQYLNQQDETKRIEDTPTKPRLSDADVLKRVFELRKLDNDRSTIKMLLEQAGATEDQISSAITRVQFHYDQEEKSSGKVIFWMGVISVIIIGLVFIVLQFFLL
jgi:rubredoxin